MAGLPLAARTVLVLHEYEDVPCQEIAAALVIPLGTVMSRLRAALQRAERREFPHSRLQKEAYGSRQG